ncbi:hypothetical protein [Sphingomonas sp. AX6]|uniref:hypothetical protein n=1 Tax=Sphingomonas sp. AX6 TaxID=2653171 RepID=UPI0012F233C9|nr:hypothetical protein [Sphingomonas sp. AX6]VXC63768.1 conserved hypothetical protein [Sphingomonas sp. AX6]
MALKFFKVAALPGVLEGDAFYFVSAPGNVAESYLTDAAGTAKSIGNTAMIEAIVGPLIAAAVAQRNQIEVVADIAARDALADPGYNQMVLVTDASADPTVDAGAALYVFNTATDLFTKVAEYESADFSFAWDNITGKPSSSPANIDDAVAKRHAHANLTTLNKLGEAAGELTFDGAPVGGGADWNTVAW